MLGRILGTFISSRFAFALLIVFAFYNVWGMSYYHWVTNTPFAGFNDPAGFGKIVVGLAFLAAFLFFGFATLRAPAKLVFGMIILVVVAIVWWMKLQGWISLADPTVGTVIAEVLIAFTFALGSQWSIIWRGRTGEQAVVDQDMTHDH